MVNNVPVAYYNALNGLHRITNKIISSTNDPVKLAPTVRLHSKRLNLLQL